MEQKHIPLTVALTTLLLATACSKDDDQPVASGHGLTNNGWAVSTPGLELMRLASTPNTVVRYGGQGDGFSPTIHSLQWSHDHGATWITSTLTGAVVDPYGLFSLYFVSDGLGFARGSAATYRTTDGGHAWSAITTNLGAVVGLPEGNTSHLFSFGGSTTYTSVNQGATWTALGPSAGTNLYCMQFVSATTGYSAGPDALRRTTDIGQHWDQVLPGRFIRLHHKDGETAAAIFSAPGSGQYILYLTSNGWADHTTMDVTATLGEPNVLRYDESGTIYVSRDNRLYRSTDQGSSWQLDLELQAEETIHQLVRSGNYLLVASSKKTARKAVPY